VPGVAQAAASVITPFNAATRSPLFADPSRTRELAISPGFFGTYGQTIRRGRDFAAADTAQAPRVAIVSAAYVRRFLDSRDPLTVTLDSGACDRRHGACAIVGVVDDAIAGPLRSGAPPTIYIPLAQSANFGAPGRTTIAVTVRAAAGSPSLLAPAVAEVLGRFNRRLTFTMRPLERDVSAAVTRERVLAVLSSFFGGLALLLSAVGLYGVTAYAATRRRAEIGIRLALGATRARVVRLVLRRMLVVTIAGMVTGSIASLWASRFVASLLFGVPPRNPPTIAAAAAVLLSVAVLASGIPAIRASRTDPAKALREA
jgi:hypothetical protein